VLRHRLDRELGGVGFELPEIRVSNIAVAVR
jgi:hypothetical protein